jgi:hypothetical protein
MYAEITDSRARHPALRNIPPTFHAQQQDSARATAEILPFTVRLVGDAMSLEKVTKIRHESYARHLPQFASTLKTAEAADFEEGAVILIAESKIDGSALGTMRIQSNEKNPLALEKSISLPISLKSCKTSEATRLAISSDRAGRMVKSLIFKAYYQYCIANNIEWMIIAGRSPLDRMYEKLLFKDVFPNSGFIPLVHAGNLPHRIMCLRVDDVEPLWAAANHPLYQLFFKRTHPDLILDSVNPNFHSFNH